MPIINKLLVALTTVSLLFSVSALAENSDTPVEDLEESLFSAETHNTSQPVHGEGEKTEIVGSIAMIGVGAYAIYEMADYIVEEDEDDDSSSGGGVTTLYCASGNVCVKYTFSDGSDGEDAESACGNVLSSCPTDSTYNGRCRVGSNEPVINGDGTVTTIWYSYNNYLTSSSCSNAGGTWLGE